MRLKSFQAKSMNDAMRQIRDSLGDEAIIVSSKEEKGGWVRVTAAVEQDFGEAEKPAKASKAPKKEPEQPAFDAEDATDMVAEAMLRHRVPASISDKVISAVSLCAPADSARAMLASALEQVFHFAPLRGRKSKAIALVGPPGAGKTLMTAKLAAEAVLAGSRPAVITTDIARAGGVEQLEAFLDILALPLLQAADAKTLKTALAKASAAPQVIVDTGGLNPFDAREMKELAKLLAAGDMDPVLILPAGIDSEEAAEIALTFEILGVRKFMPTRLDFARRLGGVLSAADRAGLAFTEASHTPQVANGILRLDPLTLAEYLMPRKGGTS